jgi:hypothetical protein
MAYKLLDSAQARWRRITGAELVPLVRAGATFIVSASAALRPAVTPCS